jgi:hypothetical protein
LIIYHWDLFKTLVTMVTWKLIQCW